MKEAGYVCVLFLVGGFFVMVPFEQRLRKCWRQPVVLWKRVPGRGSSRGKGPEGGAGQGGTVDSDLQVMAVTGVGSWMWEGWGWIVSQKALCCSAWGGDGNRGGCWEASAVVGAVQGAVPSRQRAWQTEVLLGCFRCSFLGAQSPSFLLISAKIRLKANAFTFTPSLFLKEFLTVVFNCTSKNVFLVSQC